MPGMKRADAAETVPTSARVCVSGHRSVPGPPPRIMAVNGGGVSGRERKRETERGESDHSGRMKQEEPVMTVCWLVATKAPTITRCVRANPG